MARANGFPGLYVVYDGIIGCGKSEQLRQLKKYLPLDFPETKFLFTYEPGGNLEADEIRRDLKSRVMPAEEEVSLFAKSRSITLPQVVVPALESGFTVISDRSFTTSLAYQGFGRKCGLREVWAANKNAVGGVIPDLVVWMNVGLDVCLRRSGGVNPDKFDNESRDFWGRTIEGYQQMLKFVKEINAEVRTIRIDDVEGKMGIEDMRLAIKQELYPAIREHEGRILRERQQR